MNAIVATCSACGARGHDRKAHADPIEALAQALVCARRDDHIGAMLWCAVAKRLLLRARREAA